MLDMTEKEMSELKTIIEPTVGRMVHYYENYQHGDNPPLSGQIAFVHSDRLINIGYLDTLGGHFGKINVPLIQPNDDLPARGKGSYATVVGYHIGQAAKTEALQEKLNEAESGLGQSYQDGISD